MKYSHFLECGFLAYIIRASAERNWSNQDFIVSKRRNRLAPPRAEKLVYIYYNQRSLDRAIRRMGPGITEETVEQYEALLRHEVVNADFPWPGLTDGEKMFACGTARKTTMMSS